MADTWIVVTGGQPAWGDCCSHALRMAEAFWKLGHKVLYIECGGDKKPFRRALGRRKQRAHTVFADLERRDFFVMRASQLPGLPMSFPEPVRRWNSFRTSARAARFLTASNAARVLAFHYNWSFHDLFASARETVRHIYECTDDHTKAPNVIDRRLIRRHVAKAERRLLRKAELTVFSSARLAQNHSRRARAVAVIPMAVDTEHFSQPARLDPHEKLGIPVRSADRPRVGFLGRVTERSDWGMVRAAAAETPEWQWIIVGPLAGIRARGPDNLHWVGPVKYQELPAWLQQWDVGIVPHTANTQFNRRTWPMKLLEYLASGLPVVSTDIPASRELAERLPDLVLLCREHASSSFVEAIRGALSVPAWKREAGRSFTRQHTWEARARQLLGLVGDPRRRG